MQTSKHSEGASALREEYGDRKSHLDGDADRTASSTEDRVHADDVEGSDHLSVEEFESFDDMDLKESTLRGIYCQGYERPSKIQGLAVYPFVHTRKDLLVQSQSGTGKTLSFAIGLLETIDTASTGCQALVLEPTREMADQTSRIINNVGKYLRPELSVSVCVGGTRIDRDALRKSHIIVGTPGRVFHNLSRHVDPSTIHTLVLLEGIRNYYVSLEDQHKAAALEDIYGHVSASQTIIFCSSCVRATALKEQMESSGFSVEALHGSLTTPERSDILASFRSGDIRVLVTTDLMARGIDVQQVSLVINFDLPRDLETFVHRIGRSGRFGRKGISISFVSSHRDERFMRSLEEEYSARIDELTDKVVSDL